MLLNRAKISVSRKTLPRRNSLCFVLHRHEATQLHYDLRIEMAGVLKSWALPKGPSMNPAEKRLAIRMKDHPFEYKDFEGVIPEGYGAGIVTIADKGKLTPGKINGCEGEEALLHGMKKGEIVFSLSGKKLKGGFVLVRMKGTAGKNWLLIKRHDRFASNSKSIMPSNHASKGKQTN